MTARLKNSIQALYETFNKYHSSSNMEGSENYGDADKWNDELFSKSLKELDENDLSRFTGKAITTWGSVSDYKHFLPRIFELTAELRTPYEIWIAFDKLTLGEWHNWDNNEQKVIHEFMIALWEGIVNDNSNNAEWDFKDYFSALAHFYPNFTELLNVWSKLESKGSIKHLSQYIVDEQNMLFNKKKISGFKDKSENVEEFVSWILSNKMLDKIQKKYFEFEKEEFAEKISWAEQIIVSERKNRT